MMIDYFIILLGIIISISCQQIDDIVECHNKDLTEYQLDKMNLNEQEQLVNKFYFIYKRRYRAVFQCIFFIKRSILNFNMHVKRYY